MNRALIAANNPMNDAELSQAQFNLNAAKVAREIFLYGPTTISVTYTDNGVRVSKLMQLDNDCVFSTLSDLIVFAFVYGLQPSAAIRICGNS